MCAKFERLLCGLGCANEAFTLKFDSPDEKAVKFERKSLNLSPCKRPALPVCEVNFNRVPYAVGTLGGCREYLYSRSQVGLDWPRSKIKK